MSEWVMDPDAAASYARTHGRWIDPECKHVPILCHCDPTHWTRCEYVTQGEDGTVRCRGGAGHHGEHTMPRPKKDTP